MKARNHSSLPKLPVPPLEETLKLYVRTLKPLISEEEYRENIAALGGFLKEGSTGWNLWNRLNDKAQKSDTSWLYELWNNYAYMSVREPLVPASSYFFAFADDPHAGTQERRAAVIAYNALKYRNLVVENKLAPEMQQGSPLCMKQYEYLFHTCRVPFSGQDRSHKCPDPKNHNYFTVVCNDQYYLVHFAHPSNISVGCLESVFASIINDAKKGKSPTVIGHLCLHNRDVWAKDYAELMKDDTNRKFLSLMHNSAFLVCLDPESPYNEQSLSLACFLSNGKNRFNDKSIQFIVFKNGKAGFLGEHSMMDAVPTRNLCEYVLTENSQSSGDSPSDSSGLSFEPLKSNVTQSLHQSALSALDAHAEMSKRKSMKVLLFNDYGKEVIKKFGVSPDSFVQMSFQLAYYSLYKKFCPVYESASVRLFQYGRTEAVRCLSEESKRWVLLMNNPNSSDEERYNALLSAIKYHKLYIQKCTMGNGVDRLLLGLRNSLVSGESMPELLSHKALKLSSHWVLSTSQVYSENFCGYGWSNVVDDGYGLPYMIKKNQICVTVVSSLPINAEPLALQIGSSLKKMHTLMSSYTMNRGLSPKM